MLPSAIDALLPGQSYKFERHVLCAQFSYISSPHIGSAHHEKQTYSIALNLITFFSERISAGNTLLVLAAYARPCRTRARPHSALEQTRKG